MVAVVASLALHAVSTAVAPRVPANLPISGPSRASRVEFSVVEDSPTTAVPAHAPVAAPEGRRKVHTVVPAAPEPSAPAMVEAPPGDEAPVPGPSLRRDPVDLSPLAAARTLVDVREAPDAACAAPEAPHAVSAQDGVEASLAAHIPGLTRSHEERADQVVDRTLEGAFQPWTWHRRRAGRYRYHGRGFEATILDDGSVEVRDKDGVALTPAIPFVTAEGERTLRVGAGLAVPRVDRLMPGNTADAAERREFLAHTRALREHLHEKAEARARERADVDLARALARVWDGAEPLATRKAKLFALWDDCADDEVGDLRRAQVEHFVRTKCPRGEACAFTVVDLAVFNRDRVSARPFEPYGAMLADGGVN